MSKNSLKIISFFLVAMFAIIPGASAETLKKIRSRGVIEVAVYERFVPYSSEVKGQAQGVDVAIGRALADKLGLKAKFRLMQPDESSEDDLRNNVWKGHHLRHEPADVMLHVPAHPQFAQENDKAKIIPYYRELMAVARYPRLKNVISMAQLMPERIGAEKLTLASDYLAVALGGQLRENIVLFPNLAEATEALRQGEVPAVFGPRGELQGYLAADLDKFHVTPVIMPGLAYEGWDLGIGVKAANTQLVEAVAMAMTELHAEGAFKRIFEDQGLTYEAPSYR